MQLIVSKWAERVSCLFEEPADFMEDFYPFLGLSVLNENFGLLVEPMRVPFSFRVVFDLSNLLLKCFECLQGQFEIATIDVALDNIHDFISLIVIWVFLSRWHYSEFPIRIPFSLRFKVCREHLIISHMLTDIHKVLSMFSEIAVCAESVC
jgi:hypothetical protein